MGLNLLRVLGGAAGGAQSGYLQAMQLKRQKSLDDLARQRYEADSVLRQKAEERLAKMQQMQEEDRRAKLEQDKANAADAQRQKQLADYAAPFQNFDKDAEVAAEVSPFEERARSIARQAVVAPPQNDPGIGVLAADNPDRAGMQWGKPALEGALSRETEGAQAKAHDIFARRAKDKAAESAAERGLEREKLNKPQKGPAPRLIPASAVDQVVGMDSMMAGLDQIATLTDKLTAKYSGRLSAAGNRVAGFLNVDDPEVSVFRAFVKSNLVDYVFLKSGKAVTESERAELAQIQPNENDRPETIKAKAAAFREWMRKRRGALVDTYGRAGYSTGSLGDSGLDAPPAGAEPE